MRKIKYKDNYLIVIYGSLTVLALDILGSIGSRIFDFNYSYLAIFSLFIYGYFAHLLWKKSDKRKAILFLCIIGLVDSTIGLFISVALKANFGGKAIILGPVYYVVSMIWMIIFCMVIGSISIWISKKYILNESRNR